MKDKIQGELDIPIIESSKDFDDLKPEHQAIVDSWGEGVLEKVTAYEANEQRLRNLYGPDFDTEESSTR